MDTISHTAQTKACEDCGGSFHRGPRESNVRWAKRQFCSVACATRTHKTQSVEARFSKRFEVAASGCHLWTGLKHKQGYGLLSVEGRLVLAHRVAYVLAHGPIDDDRHVLHRCDTPQCVNHEHLFLGDHDANMADMATKGRSLQGVRHHKAKLADADVIAIRADTRMQIELAEIYGVTQGLIGMTKRREIWAHLD